MLVSLLCELVFAIQFVTAGNPCPDPTPSNPASCNWYLNCLNTNFNCGSEGYAVAYGYYFCNKYDENYEEFSDRGKQWVNNVKSCLQNALLPPINDPSSYDCDTLKDYAFDSHPKCYLGNDGEYDSVCDLSKEDWGVIFDTVSEGLNSKEGYWQTILTGVGCLRIWIEQFILIFDNAYDDLMDFLNLFDISTDQFGEIIVDKLLDYIKDQQYFIPPIQMRGGNIYPGSVIFELYVFMNDTTSDYELKQIIQETINDPDFYKITLNSSQTDVPINDPANATFTLSLSEVKANVTEPNQVDKRMNMVAILVPLGIGLLIIFFAAIYIAIKREMKKEQISTSN